ncbi:ABC transporter permease [Labrys okinawensis]|uniref:ABC transporter permease n=1 Tax=Labrys okinawensis TaxID=346911 RepID=UPI0039BD7EAA
MSNIAQKKPIMLPREAGILLVLIGVALVFEVAGWVIHGQSFIFNIERIYIIVLQMAIIGIMAVGVTQIIVMAGIDLSGGSIVAFAGLVAASLAQASSAGEAVYPSLTDLPIILPLLVGLAIGAVLGLINGSIIAITGIPPFIATLAMLVIARGLARWYTSGKQVSFFTPEFASFGAGATPIWIFLGVVAVFHILMTRTLYGRRTYAIGSNELAARMAGVNVGRHKVLVYSIAGLLYGLAAVIQTSRAETAQSGTGLMWELDAISAVVIGGTSLMGGVGRVPGTVVGVLILGVLTSGFTFLGINVFYIAIAKGVIVVAAVVADRYRHRNKRAN